MRTDDLLLRILDSYVCLTILEFGFAKLLNLVILQVKLLNEALEVNFEALVVKNVVYSSQNKAPQHLLIVILVHLLQLGRVFVESVFFTMANCLPHFVFEFSHELKKECENHDPVVLSLLKLDSIVV